MKHEITELSIQTHAATCRRTADAIARRWRRWPRKSVEKIEGKRSRETTEGCREIVKREKRERLVVAQEMNIDRQIRSSCGVGPRNERSLAIVAHRWSTSIAASYHASRRML